VTPQPDAACDQHSWWLAVFSQVTGEAAGEVDGRRALDGEGVGQDARRPATVDDFGREYTFGYEYGRSV